MRVKCSQRWSRAPARRSVVAIARAYGLVSYAANTTALVVDAVVEHAFRLDANDHPVDRGVERLPVVAQREIVDVLARALFVELDRSLDLEVLVRILVVPDADADARVRSEVAALGALVRRVEDDVLAVGVDPD